MKPPKHDNILEKAIFIDYWGNQWGRGLSAKPYNDIPLIYYRAEDPVPMLQMH